MLPGESESRPSWVDELSDEERQELIEELQKEKEELDALKAETQEPYLKYLRSLVGPYADVLIHHKTETLRSIHSPDRAIRKAALSVAHTHWGLAEEIADRCEVIARTDPCEIVRETAFAVLGCSYFETKDSRIGRLLAEAVKNEKFSERTRLDAFWWLVVVDGKYEHPYISCYDVSMSNIDWGLVERYLRH